MRCSRCGRALIAESFDQHACTPDLKGVKEIPIDCYYETKTCDGDVIILAKGMDGFLYRLVVSIKPAILLPISSSDERKHPYKSDEEVTEPYWSAVKIRDI